MFALDGAVSRDAMALVGVDADWNLVYVNAWHPPKGGTIDHRQVLVELLDLQRRFRVAVVAYDPAQIHGLVLDGLDAGLPLLPVSQAAGSAGGAMARHASALVEALHEQRLRLFDSPELRQHVARARFSVRSGGDRLTKLRASDKIDLAIALAIACGVLNDLQRTALQQDQFEYEIVSATDFARAHYPRSEREFYRPGPDLDQYSFGPADPLAQWAYSNLGRPEDW